MSKLAKYLASGVLLAVATSASAVIVPFGGPHTGTDPLGHGWTASGNHWGEPGYLAGTLTFNPGNLSSGYGDFATSFSFTYLRGVGGTIDQTPAASPFGSLPETRFTNVTDGVGWLVSYDATGRTVTFTAPSNATRLDPGDTFFVNVKFTGNIDQARFSFAGLWDDAGIPEPASWAMMMAGFGLMGATMRRQQTRARLLA